MDIEFTQIHQVLQREKEGLKTILSPFVKSDQINRIRPVCIVYPIDLKEAER